MYISTRMPSRKVVKTFAQIPEIHAPKPQRIDSYTSKTLMRTVKLMAILILVGLLQVSAKTTAQQHISISIRSAKLEKAFAEIEKRSGYTIFYNVEVLKAAGLVTLNVKDASIEDVKRYGATIYVLKLKKTLVTDKDEGVMLKDVADGEYEVVIPYVGYETYKTKVTVLKLEAWLSADLKQSMGKLDETVVKGYYYMTNRLNTGDVTSVKGEDIQQQPVTDPILASERRVPELNIQQASGIPESYGSPFYTALKEN
jgi:hypothetical protein